MKTSNARLSRRHFLLTLGAGGAAGAAALATRQGAEGPGARNETIESKKGYQVTEHVRNYYRTAKV